MNNQPRALKSEEKQEKPPIAHYNWEERYREESDLPWDSGIPAPELVEYFALLKQEEQAYPAFVTEIGCGTGTNAVWMAAQGCSVVATEIAPTAIEKAKQRAGQANVKVAIHLLNICEESPVEAQSQDFVFDRGVYHVIPETQRSTFVERVAEALKAGGRWLCLAGCKDEIRDNPEEGPPQLTAVALLEHVEPYFEIVKLERSFFVLPSGKKHLAWKALYKRRP